MRVDLCVWVQRVPFVLDLWRPNELPPLVVLDILVYLVDAHLLESQVLDLSDVHVSQFFPLLKSIAIQILQLPL